MNNSERFTKRGKLLSKNQDQSFYVGLGGRWGVFESPLEHYMVDFQHLERFPGEILNNLHSLRRPVIVDLMSSTGMLYHLRADQLRGKEGKYIAVGQYDNRKYVQKKIEEKLGIQMIAGDITDQDTWNSVRREIGDSGADVVFSRALAGLEYVPIKKLTGYRMIQEAYSLLSDSGTMYLQVPPISTLSQFRIPIERWVEELNEHGIPNIYVPEYESKADARSKYGLIRIDRVSGIPELPTLDVGRPMLRNAA